jgi:hypothetical protein
MIVETDLSILALEICRATVRGILYDELPEGSEVKSTLLFELCSINKEKNPEQCIVHLLGNLRRMRTDENSLYSYLNMLNRGDKEGDTSTALYQAVVNDFSLSTILLLVKEGCDPTLRSVNGRSPFMELISRGKDLTASRVAHQVFEDADPRREDVFVCLLCDPEPASQLFPFELAYEYQCSETFELILGHLQPLCQQQNRDLEILLAEVVRKQLRTFGCAYGKVSGLFDSLLRAMNNVKELPPIIIAYIGYWEAVLVPRIRDMQDLTVLPDSDDGIVNTFRVMKYVVDEFINALREHVIMRTEFTLC